MNILQFDRECQIAKPGDNILYAQTGDNRAQIINHVYEMYEAGLVALVQRRTSWVRVKDAGTKDESIDKTVGTFDYIAQRTNLEW